MTQTEVSHHRARPATTPPPHFAPREGQLGILMRSFDRSLRALNRSKLTRDQYLMSVGQMVDYFVAHGMPDDPEKITREHVEMFLADFTEGHKPATVQTRYKCLRLFFTFLLEEREIAVHPMVNMKPPSIPETPVPIFNDDELTALLKTATRDDFVPRRDAAILRLFIDTGTRRGELAALKVDEPGVSPSIRVESGQRPNRSSLADLSARSGSA